MEAFVCSGHGCTPTPGRVPNVLWMHAQSLSCVPLFVTLWTVACQAFLSVGFPRQEYWSGLPFPPPADFPNPGIEPGLPYCWRILYQLSHREACMNLNRIYFKMLYVSPKAGDSGSIPWRRKWQPTPVFLPGKSHGQRSLADYSPWGHKEPDTTERLNNNNSLSHSSFTL